MALILEIRDRRGSVTWHHLDRLPVTLGRALSNDVILDDPYIDAQHAVIAPDDAGALTIRDLGSVNGLKQHDGRKASLPVHAGLQVQVGRTRLRFRDRDEAVVPAVADSIDRLSRVSDWTTKPARARVLVAALVGVTALSAWLESTARSVGSDLLFQVLVVLGMVLLWASVWSLAVRGPERRIQWFAQVAVTSAVALAMWSYDLVNEWLEFLFPDAGFVPIAYLGVLLFLLSALIAAHFAVAGSLTPRGRWKAGFGVSGALLLLIALGAVTDNDEFNSVADFEGQLKLAKEWMVPTNTVDEFARAVDEARKVVDESVRESARTR